MDLEFTMPEVFAVVASVYILFQIRSERGDKLDRRHSTSLGLCDSGDSFLLSPGAATHLALSDQGGNSRSGRPRGMKHLALLIVREMVSIYQGVV